MLTIVSPQSNKGWLPSANPIVFSISSTATEPKLSYIIDIVINDNTVSSLYYSVYDRNNMNLDLKTIVNDFLKDKFENDTISPDGNPLEYSYLEETLKLYIVVQEQYLFGTSMVIGDTKTSDTIFVWFSGADFQEARDLPKFYDKFEPTDIDTYGKALGMKFVPNEWTGNYVGEDMVISEEMANNAYRVTTQTKGNMNFFTYQSHFPSGIVASQATWVHLWVFNKDRYCTKYKELDMNTTPIVSITADSYEKKISMFPFGMNELNNINWSNTQLIRGTTPNIDPDEDYYYVLGFGLQDIDALLGECIKPIPFYIDCNGQYTDYSILYHSLEGGWWQVPAYMKSYKSIDIESNIKFNNYGKSAMEKIDNGTTYKSVMHREANGTITLNTDWIAKEHLIEEYKDMMLSPYVYLIESQKDGTIKYIPVVLKDNTFDIKTIKNEKLVQYTFEFEEGFKMTTLK